MVSKCPDNVIYAASPSWTMVLTSISIQASRDHPEAATEKYSFLSLSLSLSLTQKLAVGWLKARSYLRATS